MAKEYPELAIRKMNELADQGSLTSLLHLGHLYLAGDIVPKDWSLSEAYFRRAADRGSYFAYTALGALYLRQNNFERALSALSCAAGKGYPPALRILGERYYLGDGGVGKNRDRAREFLQKAAEKGSLRAKAQLARILISERRKLVDLIKGFLIIVSVLAEATIVLMIEGRSSDRLR